MSAIDDAHKLLACADALSVTCDQLDELAIPAVAQRVAHAAADVYEEAAELLEGERDVHGARTAYAHASIHFSRAGQTRDAERTRTKAVRGMQAMKISLGGVTFDAELPLRKKR